MVMSGSGESVAFVHDRPGDEALLTGGTIARLRADGADVVVLFGVGEAGDIGVDPTARADVRAAMGSLGVSDWRMLAAPAPAVHTDQAAAEDLRALTIQLSDVLDEVGATALVLGADDARLQAAASEAAHAAGIPIFRSMRVSGAIGQRVIAIDMSDHVEQKLRAVAAYPARWTVTDHTCRPAGPSNVALTGTGGMSAAGTVIGGTETFVRLRPHPAQTAEPAPGPGARALAGLLALTVGVAFGVLGTIAHLATIVIGPVVIPIGLVLSLAGVTALLAGLRLVVGDRLIVLLAVVGLLGTIFLLSLRSAGGSVLVPEGLAGTLWTIGPTLIATVVLAWPRIPARHGSA
jgi:LmbE family N-acetylglucosaminyl deacetylase